MAAAASLWLSRVSSCPPKAKRCFYKLIIKFYSMSELKILKGVKLNFTNSSNNWQMKRFSIRSKFSHLFNIVSLRFWRFFILSTDACSSRATPKPRSPSPTARPNVTFHTYACPPAYAAWYCLNGATCFTVRIGESLLYNCEWVYRILIRFAINHCLRACRMVLCVKECMKIRHLYRWCIIQQQCQNFQGGENLRASGLRSIFY